MTPRLEAILDEDPMRQPVHIQGARGSFHRDDVIDAIQDATKTREAVVQAFRPDAIYGANHLKAAARRALRSHAQDRAIARELAVEIALYAAGTTQIEDALALVGLPTTGDKLILASVGPGREAATQRVLDAVTLEPTTTLPGNDEDALDRLGISKRHRDRVGQDRLDLLVQEHVALLDTRS